MLLNVFPKKTNMYQACKFLILLPPQFLSGTLYFKFLDGVGGEKTKSIPANNSWQNPYQVLAKVHASYISSLIIYT